MLNREVVRQVQDLKLASVEVPEWGQDEEGNPEIVYVKAFSGEQREEYEGRAFATRESENPLKGVRVNLVISNVCNEDGSPIFVEEDREWLGKKNGDVLTRLVEEILKVSGLGA